MIVSIALIFFLHWLFDFVFQSSWMARNKYKSQRALLAHCAVYACWGPIFAFLIGVPALAIQLYLFLISSHFIIDFFTSKITHYLWEKQKVHDFFVVIGFDQFLHYVVILLFFQSCFK